MHNSTILGELIIPDVDDTADVPTHLAALVGALEKYVVIPVANAAARPSSPHHGMTIYQKDTHQMLTYITSPVTGWYPPWDQPWGRVDYAERTTTQTGIGSALTDLTSLTMTPSIVNGRRYRVHCKVNINVTTQNGGYPGVSIIEAGSEIMQDQFGPANINITNPTFTFHTEAYTEPGITGTRTWKIQATSGVSGQIVQALSGASRPNWIAIDDVGPAL